MYDNILYPTDGSEAAESVMDHVRTLSNTYGAAIHREQGGYYGA